MPQATFVQDGCAIDYTPGAAVAAGNVVVQGALIGVAKRPIAANELGALSVEGVFDFPKATGGGSAVAAGVNVYWDVGHAASGRPDSRVAERTGARVRSHRLAVLGPLPADLPR